jgi:hypothetical protein
LKWIEGAGNDNLVSWATTTTVNHSHPDINGGNSTSVERLVVNVPSTITPPTLTAPAVTYTVGSTTGAYVFSGTAMGNNPEIGPFYRGGTYTININASGHPFYFTTDNGTNFASNTYFGEYTNGVTGSRTDNGTITFTVPAGAPDVLYYQCGVHGAMRGTIRVKDLAVETNANGNYLIYGQHTQESHAQTIELRPIPTLTSQMCLVYDSSTNKFVPQDLSTYVENTPAFENKIKEVAGTATLIAPDGTSLVASVNIYSDATYLPAVGNTVGDIAFVEDTQKLYIYKATGWIETVANADLTGLATEAFVQNYVANNSPGGGNVVEYTSTNTAATNDIVMLNSDGTVTVVEPTNYPFDQQTAIDSQMTSGYIGDSNYRGMIAHHSTREKGMLIFPGGTGHNDRTMLVVFSRNGSGISKGTAFSSGEPINNFRDQHAFFGPAGTHEDKFLYIGAATSGGNINVGTGNITGTTVNTTGTDSSAAYSNTTNNGQLNIGLNGRMAVDHGGFNGTVLTFYVKFENSNNKAAVRKFTYDFENQNLDHSFPEIETSSSETFEWEHTAIDPSTPTRIALYRQEGVTSTRRGIIKFADVDWDAGTINIGPSADLFTRSGSHNVDAWEIQNKQAFHPTNGLLAAVTTSPPDGGGDAPYRLKVALYSADANLSITNVSGNLTLMNGANVKVGTVRGNIAWTKGSNTGSTPNAPILITPIISNQTGSSPQTKYIQYDNSGNYITQTTDSNTFDLGSMWTYSSPFNDGDTASYSPDTVNSQYPQVIMTQGPYGESNFDATKLHGVAASAGTTIDVTLEHGIHTGLSGLTTGTKYFVTDSGGISTSGSAKLGTAINATSLALDFTDELTSADLGTYATKAYVGQQITAAGSYSDASVDIHLNQNTATSNEVLSWNGTDYEWVAQPTNNNQLTNGANYITAADVPNANTVEYTSTSSASVDDVVMLNSDGTVTPVEPTSYPVNSQIALSTIGSAHGDNSPHHGLGMIAHKPTDRNSGVVVYRDQNNENHTISSFTASGGSFSISSTATVSNTSQNMKLYPFFDPFDDTKVLLLYTRSNNARCQIVDTAANGSISINAEIDLGQLGSTSNKHFEVDMVNSTSGDVKIICSVPGFVTQLTWDGTNITAGTPIATTNNGYHRFSLGQDGLFAMISGTSLRAGKVNWVGGTVSEGAPLTVTDNGNQAYAVSESGKIAYAFYDGNATKISTFSIDSSTYACTLLHTSDAIDNRYNSGTPRPHDIMFASGGESFGYSWYGSDRQNPSSSDNKAILGTVASNGTITFISTPNPNVGQMYSFHPTGQANTSYRFLAASEWSNSMSQKGLVGFYSLKFNSYNPISQLRLLDFPYSESNLDVSKIHGLATSSGTTIDVTIENGIHTGLSGLTVGSKYYVLENGTLSTSPDSNNAKVGLAITSTSLALDFTDELTDASLATYATKSYVTTQVANLVDSAPATLDTLNELAAALGDDANFSTTVTNSLANKADTSSLATVATSGSYNDLSNTPTIPNPVDISGKQDRIIGPDIDAYGAFDNTTTISLPSSPQPRYYTISEDGKRLWAMGAHTGVANGQLFYQWDLTTAYDVSTNTNPTQVTIPIGTGYGFGWRWNGDGTKVTYISFSNRTFYGFNVATAYDVSTITSGFGGPGISSQDNDPMDFIFDDDGDQLLVLGKSNDKVYRYTLSTPYDVNTLTFQNSYSIGNNVMGNSNSIDIAKDGKTILIGEGAANASNTHRMFEYTLATAWDFDSFPSQSQYTDRSSFISNIGGHSFNFAGVRFSPNGEKLIISGNSNSSSVYEQMPWVYTVGASVETALNSFATVATSGSYNDLSNTPTIPTNNNQLTNGAGFITAADVINANVVEYTSTSSASVDDVVMLNSDGTVTPVEVTTTNANGTVATLNPAGGAGNNFNKAFAGHFPSDPLKVLQVYRSNTTWRAQILEDTVSNYTWYQFSGSYGGGAGEQESYPFVSPVDESKVLWISKDHMGTVGVQTFTGHIFDVTDVNNITVTSTTHDIVPGMQTLTDSNGSTWSATSSLTNDANIIYDYGNSSSGSYFFNIFFQAVTGAADPYVIRVEWDGQNAPTFSTPIRVGNQSGFDWDPAKFKLDSNNLGRLLVHDMLGRIRVYDIDYANGTSTLKASYQNTDIDSSYYDHAADWNPKVPNQIYSHYGSNQSYNGSKRARWQTYTFTGTSITTDSSNWIWAAAMTNEKYQVVSLDFLPNSDSYVTVYRNQMTYTTVKESRIWDSTVTGNSIFTSGAIGIVQNASSSAWMSHSFDYNTNSAHGSVYYQDSSNSSLRFFKGKITTSNLDASKVHGIAATSGTTIDVTVENGIHTGLSGLTVGSKYYVLEDGSISLTPDINDAKVGLAITSTSLALDFNDELTSADLGTYATKSYVATQTFSGSYNDLTNKPTIPTNNNQLTNGAGFITAASLSGYATETYVNTQVSNLVDSAPATLDTLNELAAALGDDANFSTTITNQIAAKADAYSIATVTASGGNFYIDGVQQVTLSFEPGRTYRFDQADSSNGSHPLRFSTNSDGTHGGGSEYTTGVTTNGTAGSAGAYVQIAITNATPTLYYYCVNHSGMGAGSVVGNFSGNYNDLTNLPTLFDGQFSSLTGTPSLYTDSAVDTHLNISGATTGQILSWNGTDYAWIDAAAGGGSSVSVSATAPSSPSEGDLWFDEDDLVMYVWYTDGDSSQWIEANSVTAAAATIHASDTAPSGPSSGDLWFNTTLLDLYVYYADGDSNQWVQVGGAANSQTSGSGGGSSVQSLIETANTSVTTTDTGTDGHIDFTTNGTARWEITSNGHILPHTNASFDIGSAEKKVRYLFLDSNTMFVGDTSFSEDNIDRSMEVYTDQSAPSSSTDEGKKGDVRIVGNYMYVCINTNEWIRTQIEKDW